MHSRETAKAVFLAISPDNHNMPEGIKILITKKKGELELIVKTKDVGSMIATLEDIFQCIQAAEITIKELT